MNNQLVAEFMNKFVNCHPNPDQRVKKSERFSDAIDYLRCWQGGLEEPNVEVAYAELKERQPVTADNCFLRSDLSIFMNWYTIQLEHIESTEES